MKRYQAGDSSILAEIIVDYEKKDVQILDPVERHSIQGHDWNFSLSLADLFLMLFCITFSGFFLIFGFVIISLIIIAIWFLIVVIKIAFKPMFKKLHKVEQVLFNDMFELKKFMVIEAEDLKEKVWKLPYEFDNIKCDWDLFGDFKNCLKKVHIKPKDYFFLRFGEKTRQDCEWEAIFYFSELPKTGRMEITWI